MEKSREELILEWARWNFGLLSWLKGREQPLPSAVKEFLHCEMVAQSKGEESCEMVYKMMLKAYHMGQYIGPSMFAGSMAANPPPIEDPEVIEAIRYVSKGCNCMACEAKRILCQYMEWQVVEQEGSDVVGIIMLDMLHGPNIGKN